MKKTVIGVAVATAVLLVSTGIVVTAQNVKGGSFANHSSIATAAEKKAFMAEHDKKQKEAESKAKEQAVANAINADESSSSRKYAPPTRTYPGPDEICVYTPKVTKLPMSGEMQRKYQFTTIGCSSFDLIMAGSSADDPNQGVLLDRYVDPKTMQEQHFDQKIDGTGALTLTQIKDGHLFSFTTATGKNGVLDVTTHTYSLDK